MTRFEVAAAQAGARLDAVVADALGWPRTRAARAVADGRVRVDGRERVKALRVSEGQVVEVAPEPASEPIPPPPCPPVLYEDADLLIVDKPAGLVVHPGAGHPAGTLVDALRAAGVELAPGDDPERPGIVHRLDRDTSGVLAVAKTEAARAGMVARLQAREVDRAYLALVDGSPARARARIEAPLGRDPRDRLRFAVVADGREAVTRYERLALGQAPTTDGADGQVALLRCRLETGRTHQIRVHLSSIGHPVTGDETYRADGRRARALDLRRPFLHAVHLAFAHPVTGAQVAVDSPLPPELCAAAGRADLPEAHLPGC